MPDGFDLEHYWKIVQEILEGLPSDPWQGRNLNLGGPGGIDAEAGTLMGRSAANADFMAPGGMGPMDYPGHGVGPSEPGWRPLGPPLEGIGDEAGILRQLDNPWEYAEDGIIRRMQAQDDLFNLRQGFTRRGRPLGTRTTDPIKYIRGLVESGEANPAELKYLQNVDETLYPALRDTPDEMVGKLRTGLGSTADDAATMGRGMAGVDVANATTTGSLKQLAQRVLGGAGNVMGQLGPLFMADSLLAGQKEAHQKMYASDDYRRRYPEFEPANLPTFSGALFDRNQWEQLQGGDANPSVRINRMLRALPGAMSSDQAMLGSARRMARPWQMENAMSADRAMLGSAQRMTPPALISSTKGGAPTRYGESRFDPPLPTPTAGGLGGAWAGYGEGLNKVIERQNIDNARRIMGGGKGGAPIQFNQPRARFNSAARRANLARIASRSRIGK